MAIGNLNKAVTHIDRDIILVKADYTVKVTDDMILCNGTFTLTLPVLPIVRETMFKILNIGTGTVTINRSDLRAVKVANSNLISGATTHILRHQYSSITLLSYLNDYYLMITKSVADIYDLDPTPSVDLSWNGSTIIGTAGEDLLFAQLLYLKSDNKFGKADADTETTASGLLAVATETILANATGTLLLKGFIRQDTWNWTVGEKLYIHPSAGNFLSGVPVSSGDIIRIVGHAYNADVIYFNPDNFYTIIP